MKHALLSAAALSVLAFAPLSANALTATPFTVNTDAIGEPAHSFTASFADFSYTAEVDQTGTSFTETGGGFFGTFRHPTLLSPPVSNTGLGVDYNLYAVFSGAGTTSTGFGGLGIIGDFSTFMIDIYADTGMDTVFNTPGVGGPNESIAAGGVIVDDIHVATSGILYSDQFRVFPGLANGDFNVLVGITSLNTGIGSGFFFASPFTLNLSLALDMNGVNTSVQGVALPGTNFTDGIIDGSGNVSIQPVPEPETLLLLAAGLVGMGIGQKKRYSL